MIKRSPTFAHTKPASKQKKSQGKSLHTPGPWKWWDAKSGRPKTYDLAKLLNGATDQHGELILTVYGGEGNLALGKSKRAQADARLIAAAPELLRAAKLTLAFINDLSKSNPGFLGKLVLQDYGQYNEAMIALPRAITKALGDTSVGRGGDKV